MKLKIVNSLFLSAWVCGAVFAEPRILPPVVDNSTYPAGRSDKPSANHSIYETLGRLEQLQAEVQQLRGETEEQAYTILQLKTRIKNIYTDFDQRLELLEQGASASTTHMDGMQQQMLAKPAQNAAMRSAQLKISEKTQYQKAYDTLRNGHYNQAIQLFNQLLQDFPQGLFSDNAQYWLGEAYKVSKNKGAAEKAFNKVISNYPNSPKVADAMYKLGLLQLEKNNLAKARDLLTGVTVRFPGTTAAHLASKKLAQLN